MLLHTVEGDLLEIPVTAIRRPLGRTRSNDQDKVQALMDSIQEVGLKEPLQCAIEPQIDILEVDGKYYGFSGCHRYEAFQRLGIEKIPCKVRKANQNTLKMHM
ncbi:MAG: chloroplastic mitochondrial-like, partial [Trebouxia sp. A1-2]